MTTISGFAELDKALGDLKRSTAKTVLRRTLTKALQPVVDEAKRLAPVDDGDLRDSIVVGTKLSKSVKAAAKDARLSLDPADTDFRVTVYAGTANRQGVPREFGTLRSLAQPFMRPAWDRNKGEVLSIIERELGGEIERAAKRAARRAR